LHLPEMIVPGLESSAESAFQVEKWADKLELGLLGCGFELVDRVEDRVEELVAEVDSRVETVTEEIDGNLIGDG